MKYDEKWMRIIRLLYERKNYVTINALAHYVEVSTKTVYKLLNDHQQYEAQIGICLQSRFGKGYQIVIQEEQRFHNFLAQGEMSSDGNEARISYLLTRLIQRNEYIRIEDLADELYVSRATIDRLMTGLKDILQEYKLTLSTKPKYGICIKGSEVNKRICFAHYTNDKQVFEEQAVLTIQKLLLEVIEESQLQLNDINLYNLVYHCVIALSRIRFGNYVESLEPILFDITAQKEQLAAANIVTRIQDAFHLQIPKNEESYIVLHLLGKRVLDNRQNINPLIWDCLDDIFHQIYASYHIDFSANLELRTALALHIQPMITRLQFGMKQENQMLTQIKREMSLGYEMSLIVADVLKQQYQLHLNEDEAGYLAVHFALALEKRAQKEHIKKVVLVCTSGRGTAKLIQYKLMKRYQIQEEDLLLTSMFQLDAMELSSYACILSTISLSKVYPIPVIVIDPSLREYSMKQLDDLIKDDVKQNCDFSQLVQEDMIFSSQNLTTVDDILSFLSEKARQQYPLEDTFLEELMKREALSSTEVGNFVAMPHPYTFQEAFPVIGFLSLKKPIHWKNTNVKLVILMALPLQQSELIKQFNEAIARVICQDDLLSTMMYSLDKETILTCLGGN